MEFTAAGSNTTNFFKATGAWWTMKMTAMVAKFLPSTKLTVVAPCCSFPGVLSQETEKILSLCCIHFCTHYVIKRTLCAYSSLFCYVRGSAHKEKNVQMYFLIKLSHLFQLKIPFPNMIFFRFLWAYGNRIKKK